MRHITIFLIVFGITLNGCKNNNKNLLNSESELNYKTSDTVYKYYKNGTLKEKGLFIDNLETGWWSYYSDQGRLVDIKEFLIINDSTHLNQQIHYNINNEIDIEKSSFINLKIPDTLFLGRNLVSLDYYSHFKNPYKKTLSVVVDNTYSNNEIKKDVFGDNSYGNKPEFGIYAHQVGDKIVRGNTIEVVFYKENIGKDSASAKMIEHKKYFSKEVYVKDTLN